MHYMQGLMSGNPQGAVSKAEGDTDEPQLTRDSSPKSRLCTRRPSNRWRPPSGTSMAQYNLLSKPVTSIQTG